MRSWFTLIWAALVVLLPHLLPSPFDEPLRTTGILVPLGLWIFISYRAFLPYGFAFVGLSSFCGASAIILYTYPHVFWEGFGLATMSSFGSVVAGAFLYAAIIAIGCALPSSSSIHGVVAMMRIAAILNAIVICVHAIKGLPRYWLFDNPAMDATFIALFTGIRTKSLKIDVALWILALVAINLTGSSTGLMVMSICCAAGEFIRNEASKRTKIIATVILIAVFLGIGYLRLGNDLINSSGRFHVWKLSLGFWNQFVNKFTGAGIGTFFLYGPGLQLTERLGEVNNVMDKMGHIEAFFWMHNDWLQILFELGIIGFLLSVIVAIKSLCVCYFHKSSNVFSVSVGFCAAMLTQFPLHQPITALLAGCLIRLCFAPPEEIAPKYYHYHPTNEEYQA